MDAAELNVRRDGAEQQGANDREWRWERRGDLRDGRWEMKWLRRGRPRGASVEAGKHVRFPREAA